jgi:cytochrome P450
MRDLHRRYRVLIFGAQDTSASALTRILYMLALRPDVQDHIRREIDNSGAEERLSLEQISALSWLDAVLKETLRLCVPTTSPYVHAQSDIDTDTPQSRSSVARTSCLSCFSSFLFFFSTVADAAQCPG